MKSFLRNLLPNQHPFRLFYHKLMAMMASFWYRFPANELTVIAVTGTNGKTTTSNYIHHLFMEAGRKAGLLTTVHFKIGARTEVNLHKQTTVSPWILQRKLRQMVKESCQVAIVETTSHAMIQNRLWGVNVDTAVFTNLTQDHLSYHGSMEQYRAAKGLLFKHLNASKRKPGIPKVAVINQDDPNAAFFNEFPVDQSYPYGVIKGTYAAKNLVLNADGSEFLIKIPNGEATVRFPIPGRMNIMNALAAATVAIAHKINLNVIASALSKMPPVPGRIEIIDEGQAPTVIVDYAHSEDSLSQLLSMFKDLTSGKVILVFGATGGGRDQGKRPKMGGIAHRFADEIILTNDDPYEEDPVEIATMVRKGIPREEGSGFWQVLDRREAIRLALSMAGPSDTVLVAGKGAEEFTVIGTKKIDHDDRAVVRELLARTVDVTL